MTARRHHYVFAHILLPQVAHQHPQRFFTALMSPNGQEYLKKLWFYLGEDPAIREDAITDLGPTALSVHQSTVGQYPCLVIEMPTPQEMPEVYLVGLVLIPDKGGKNSEPDKSEVRYFTLEFSYDPFDGCEITMLCEHTHDAHKNFGTGPPPEVAAFTKAISRIIN